MERGRHLADAAEAGRGVFGQRFLNHRFGGRWQLRIELSRRRRRLCDMLHHDGRGRISLEGYAAANHLVQHDAQRVQIAARIHRLTRGLLRRHVGRRPHHAAGGAELSRIAEHLGDAEIGQDRLALGREHDVGRFDIAMNGITFVRVVQGRGQFCQQARRFGQRHDRAPAAPLRQAILQRAAIQVFHDHERLLVFDAKVVQLNNVRMTE